MGQRNGVPEPQLSNLFNGLVLGQPGWIQCFLFVCLFVWSFVFLGGGVLGAALRHCYLCYMLLFSLLLN